MEIIISDFGDLGKRVALNGRLDIAGAGKIDMPLKELADSKTNIVVDMSKVNFIASLGMRSLVDPHARRQDPGFAEPDAARGGCPDPGGPLCFAAHGPQ
jgi:anti-anti-sigma regulatory factor